MPFRGVAAALAVCLLAAGCAGDSDDDAAPQASSPTVTTPAVTPEDVKTAVFERAYSDCATHSVRQLAATYAVDPNRRSVVEAVASTWTDRFGAGRDAIQSGRDGCRLGFQHAKNPPGQAGSG